MEGCVHILVALLDISTAASILLFLLSACYSAVILSQENAFATSFIALV